MNRVIQVASLAGRAAASYAGRKQPLLGGVKLTHRCNLSCLHCPFWQRDQRSLTFPEVLDSLDGLRRLGVRFVIFEGGEPFLWRDGDHRLADVIREARARFDFVGVTTNGTFPIDVDADAVWISIDGLRATHDRIRGESFDTAIGHIEDSTHPNLYAHMTINALNQEDIPELVAFMAPRVRGITLQLHYPYGVESDDGLRLSQRERLRVLNELIRLKRAGAPLVDSLACLRALRDGRWRCRPWLVASVDPDGALTRGCYVRNRGPVSCEACGFAAHAELSLAFAGRPSAIRTGLKIFMPRKTRRGTRASRA
jgi:MoaA/NifB/PqqE/SkfB family radical SAM enzyme